MEPGEFWSDDVSLEAAPRALTEEAIVETERRLGLRLPSAYLDLLRIRNGGDTRGFAFPTKGTSWAEDHCAFEQMAGLEVGEGADDFQNPELTEYMTREWDLPPRQFLLCGDGHTWITLDYRASSEPRVTWLDVELDVDLELAPSFSEFLSRLQPESAFG